MFGSRYISTRTDIWDVVNLIHCPICDCKQSNRFIVKIKMSYEKVTKRRTDVYLFSCVNNDFFPFFKGHTGSYGSTDEPRRKRQDDSKPNHILLFTIINPMYPITVVSTIFNRFSERVRISLTPRKKSQLFIARRNIWLDFKIYICVCVRVWINKQHV